MEIKAFARLRAALTAALAERDAPHHASPVSQRDEIERIGREHTQWTINILAQQRDQARDQHAACETWSTDQSRRLGVLDMLLVESDQEKDQFRAALAAREAEVGRLLDHIRVEGRLGEYLNTMVADLGLLDRGQYLRELFAKFEAEALAISGAEAAEVLTASVELRDATTTMEDEPRTENLGRLTRANRAWQAAVDNYRATLKAVGGASLETR
jgi:hypothetical protein